MKILLCFVLMCCMSGLVSAQMTAAKKVPPAIEKKIVLKVSAQKVWDYISEPANYKKFSGVKKFTCEEKALNAKIELTGKDDKKRSQYISVIDYDVFKICYFVTQSDYAGNKQWVYAFEVHSKGDKKCEVVLSVYNGFDELSPEFKK
ncbi:MAG TPA: SRPBCC family protein, partial [Candidatus Butyricimonas faecavium]|nr:SRPBCC family protein [Candidatus Butyricimonas faecavium]